MTSEEQPPVIVGGFIFIPELRTAFNPVTGVVVRSIGGDRCRVSISGGEIDIRTKLSDLLVLIEEASK